MPDTNERLDTLEGALHRLTVLAEENTRQIHLLAEGQAHHGVLLQRLVGDMDEMKTAMHPLIDLVARNHELRIARLKEEAGFRPPDRPV